MSRETINRICAALPGAEVSDPWGGGHDAWKVGAKLFAVMGAVAPGVSIKTDSIETAALLIEMGAGQRAAYLHRSWVTLSWDLSEDELSARIERSYRLIRASLPKKVQAGLG